MWAGRGGGSWLLGSSVILNKRGKSAPRAKQIIPRKGAGGGGWSPVPVLSWQEARTKGTGSARGEGLGSGDAVKSSRQAVEDVRLWQALSGEVPEPMVWWQSVNTQRKGSEGQL